MRIAIDARPALDPRRTGVGSYTQQLIRHLPQVDPEDGYVAWYTDARGLLRSRTYFGDPGAPNLSEKAARIPARVFQPVAWRLGLPRLDWLVDFDVFVATNFVAPARGRGDRVVPVVHDLAFRHLPETAPQIDARWLRLLAETLAAAPAIVVPSASAAADLAEAFPGVTDRVHVVPHGVDASAYAPVPQRAIDDVRHRFGIGGRYVLFLGGIEPRKNLEHLVRAFDRAGPRDVSLVIAGGPVRWLPKAADRLEAVIALLPPETQERIVRTGYVSERDKVVLLSGATVLAYPSVYEGFGFPVLEGFAAGVPVLTSNVSSLPEVAGDAAMLVDPADVDALASALTQLLLDEDLRAVLTAAGLARAATFTWEATARTTASVVRSVGATLAG